MEVTKASEAFKETDSRMKFSYVKYVIQQDGALYGKTDTSLPRQLEQLDEVQQIQIEDRASDEQHLICNVY